MARNLIVPGVEEQALGRPEGQSVRPQPTGFAESEQFGRNVQSAVGDLTEIAQKIQAEEDQTAVTNAETALKEYTLERQREAKNQLGENARGLSARESAAWKKKNDEIAAALTPRQRQAYSTRAANVGLQHTDTLALHEQGERKRAADDADTASLSSARSMAAANAQDPRTRGAAVSQAHVTIINRVASLAARGGWSEERREARLLEETTKLHTDVINNIVDSDPVGAEIYYRAKRLEIDGGQYDKLEKALEIGGARREAQRFAEAYQAGISQAPPGDLPQIEADALELARKKYTGKRQDEAVSEIHRRIAERRGQIKAVKDTAGDTAWRLSTQAGSYSAVPAGVITEMDGKEQAVLKDYWEQKAQGKAIKTNWDVYYDLRGLADNPTTQRQFASMRLNPFFNQLADAEKRSLIELQDRLTKDPVRFQSDVSLSQRLASIAASRGITDTEKRGQFDTYVYDRILVEERNLGRKLSTEERDKIIDSAVIEGSRRFFGLFRGIMAFETQERAAATAGTPEAAAPAPTAADLAKIPASTQSARRALQDIPAADIESIQRVLTRKGKSVTAEAIIEHYTRRIGSGAP